MNKKTIAFILLGSLVLVGVITLVARLPRSADAASTYTKDLFPTTNLLGYSLMKAGGLKMHFIDVTDATTTWYVFLPSVSAANIDGSVHIVRRIGSAGYNALVEVASGESIEGDVNPTFNLENDGDYVWLVADQSVNGWWVINRGNSHE